MRCIDAELILPLLFDGDLDEASARILRSHLYACGECRELFSNMLLVKAMGRVMRRQWGRFSDTSRLSLSVGQFLGRMRGLD